MMMSLFSMFDPSASFNLSINWMLMLLTILILPLEFWKMKSRTNTFFKMLIMSLHNEFKTLFNKQILSKGSTLMPITLFIIIINNNIISNFPYNFCCSAHLSFSMSLSIPMWMSIIMFYWFNLTKTMLSHLVPTGTPMILMPIMVMIELTSNIIRPMALAVRLTANLIAGHLLMALLGNTLNISSLQWPIIMLIQTMFLSFELMVATIQAYVFSVLMTLYSSEIS